VIFALTVVGYTTFGGFWAVTWTDVLEGVVMLVGVVVMAVLAVLAVPAFTMTDGTTLTGLAAATARIESIDSQLVYGPGPNNFMPLGLAFSFFVMWTMISAGQPGGMVRLMSFKDVPSLRRALLLVVGYYVLTYFSLLVIFICARAIHPTAYLGQEGSEGQPDEIMPAMARYLTRTNGVPWLGGLLLAAPYAAIMSTVAAFLLLISSSLVRDLYQRVINPKASEKTLKRMSYFITAGVGGVVMLLALNPPKFLQFIIVFTGSGQGCAFLFPMLLALYWKGATRQGVLAGMLGGFAVLLLFYVLGWSDSGLRDTELHGSLNWIPGWGEERLDGFAPLYAGGVDPLVWGLLASLLLTFGVSLMTRPDAELVKKYFPE
jgi:SSS family solute:Na+ symporter/sodium/pantothenate symporter